MDGQAAFHYVSCGLRNIWLRNGFEISQTPYGEAVAIHNLKGLHKAIGLDLVRNKPRLTGGEVRFLRKEMDLPQAQLAKMLAVSENTIRAWENDRQAITGPAERILRQLFLEYANERSELRELIDRISQLNRDRHETEKRLEFLETEGQWQAAA